MIIKKIFTISLLLLSFLSYAADTPEPTSEQNTTSSSSKNTGGLSGLADKLGISGFGNSNEPLPPDEAFQLDVSAEGNQINAIWSVTPEHYLYKDKTRFKIKSPEGATLGAPVFPPSKTKNDEFLGKTEVYEHDFSVTVPVNSSTEEVTIETSYQGCSESTGICYPPQKKTHTVKLAALDSSASTGDSTGGLSGLADELGIGGLGGSNEPLPPDEAFKLEVSAEGNQINAIWSVTPEHYLYKDKTQFKIKSPADATLGAPVFPASKTKNDEFLGKTEVYEQDFSVTVPVNSSTEEVTIETTYQGCSESTGICYPPQRKTHTVKLAALGGVTTNLPEDVKIKADQPVKQAVSGNTTVNNGAADADISEQDAILNKIKNKSTTGTILMFLIFGLGLALTPCVFPMIPILSGIIAGQGKDITTRKAFSLSLAYVLPMALVYAIVGIIAGLGGANIQILFQNPWVISAFAILFVLLSLSMFGFYELQMPASIQTKLTNISNRQESGSYIGAAIMGVLSALIVGPCVTAPLIAALTYIAQTGDAVLGGLSLFALGLGMGIPLILIGTSAGKLLPRAGAWMEATKAVFGVMMLALAIWMLERILPFPIIIALTAILLIVSGIYLNAISPIPEGKSKWSYLWKGIGFILLLYGSLMLIGVASGGKSLLQPLKGVMATSSTSVNNNPVSDGLVFERVLNLAEFDGVLARAKSNNQAVMLDFYADWCVSCKEMEHLTFKNQDVIKSLENVILIQADVTANNDDDKALLKKFGLFGPPGILFFTPEGNENKTYRKVGFVAAKPFVTDVKKFLATLK